jgi:hypothetical protein
MVLQDFQGRLGLITYQNLLLARRALRPVGVLEFSVRPLPLLRSAVVDVLPLSLEALFPNRYPDL